MSSSKCYCLPYTNPTSPEHPGIMMDGPSPSITTTVNAIATTAIATTALVLVSVLGRWETVFNFVCSRMIPDNRRMIPDNRTGHVCTYI